ncbi:DNA cytosine methyltransferase [Phocoenobacter skyensis]|uniref:Cytosine-specific methyltransferase n=1 Tax=Phocoenobacter skyensis TaxID=97481 RepID=A0A1H7ZEW4_9PAST|nr:DNA (cytosine-5-)-methyltransferase [Pasteurella skyensis]MDP8079884.1 DNA (cytosine-5-)-methyltransferase [Pasteurella skyensis]MDP8085794.1 DNA (cytosine-5-)-methyltransferase [Pasteurella skyensis]MDP8185983.1 DNA (cytosine-5-)-methyltransferase [Pasteurella skyensis]QLB21880.1 DNA (cytosine-5-)-methyltransferase [Pasteurella skyensis]SEM57112.1 DNA (cytosine-5)-methyltransferase 1 [Pasteurella skyensis]
MKKNLLSLFSGCGGMDIGFEGGFKVLKSTINSDIHSQWIEDEDDNFFYLKDTIFQTEFANDINEQAKITWNDYFSNKRNKDLSNTFKVASIVDLVKDYRKGNKNIFPDSVDIVTGGFPCQDFSVSGKRKGFNSHKDHNGNIIEDSIPTKETRGKLYMWMKEVIEITLPKIFIAENVKGLANLGDIKDIIQSDFSSINGDSYLVLPPQILHAGQFGIPQSRERIFFIGLKKSSLTDEALKELSKENIDEKVTPYPVPTHRLNGEFHFSSKAHLMKEFTKSKSVLLDLEEPEQSDDLSQKFYSKAKFMGKHCQGQKEIDLNKLAPTIRSEHHGNIEFRRLDIENGGIIVDELERGLKQRRLTLRECARIQTFPDNFNFVISKNKNHTKFFVSPSMGYKLVGNAVPPLLAYHIAKKIESNWDFYFGKEEYEKQ